MPSLHSPLPLAVSACLRGQPVRYDGKHKLLGSLASWPAHWHPICPEVAIGLPVPRPPIEQRLHQGELQLVEVQNPQQQYQEAMAAYAASVAQYIQQHRICGYVLMHKSPSCAVHSSTIKSAQTALHQPGYFVRELTQWLPALPLLEAQQVAHTEAVETFWQKAREYALRYH